jgi:hypothetical protein
MAENKPCPVCARDATLRFVEGRDALATACSSCGRFQITSEAIGELSNRPADREAVGSYLSHRVKGEPDLVTLEALPWMTEQGRSRSG